MKLPLRLLPAGTLGGLQIETAKAPLKRAVWYLAQAVDDGVAYEFPRGALAGATYLTCDLLLDGQNETIFRLSLREGDAGRQFDLYFSLLNQCSARLRLPLASVRMNAFYLQREAAWLKPRCQGQPVDLALVDRMQLCVKRKAPGLVRWCHTPIFATAGTPPRLARPLLPRGPLIDRLGQSAQRKWRGKTKGVPEVVAHLRRQFAAAPRQRWPVHFSRWGGWRQMRFNATGFFHTHHDGRRWWLVDPDGHAFWSAGADCVAMSTHANCTGLQSALAWRPPATQQWAGATSGASGASSGRQGDLSICYLTSNVIRAFGAPRRGECWSVIALAELRRMGFNTVGNWSRWQIAAAAGFPYVLPMSPALPGVPKVFRDFPDVFAPRFAGEATRFGHGLAPTAADPALVGYFMMNEPGWSFTELLPAEGMLINTPQCATREALARWLKEKYGSAEQLAAGWGMDVSLEALAAGPWRQTLTAPARADLQTFSTIMVSKLFGGLAEACKAADPNHLNLGVRYYTVPPAWTPAGMRGFDVYSINCYQPVPPAEALTKLSDSAGLPVMIGEWHFGALDVGLPGTGIGHVRDQKARGQAFRVYTEAAAALPCCVGAHYFTLYDQSALGRFDGENWNIGLVDVCHRPYEPVARAARKSHERLYEVAAGEAEPFAERPEYLPAVF